MLYGIIKWFKSRTVNSSDDERGRRFLYDDRSTRGLGRSHNYGHNSTFPKTSLQLAEAEFFRNQLTQNQEHFNTLNASVFEPLLNYHVDLCQRIYGPDIISWYSFKIQYDISGIVGSNLYPNAQRHLRLDVPGYEDILTRIAAEITDLNKSVSDSESKVRDKVQNKLSEFSLISLEGRPTVLSKLEYYWFNNMIRRYRTERIWYKNLITEPSLFETKLKEKDNQLMSDATAIASLPIDRADFSSKVNDLMKDYEIFDLMMDLVRKREQIADLINDYTRDLSRLTVAIHNETYHTLTNCCPSQQVAAIS